MLGNPAYYQIKVGSWISKKVVTTDEAISIISALSNTVLHMSVVRLTTLEELTGS